MHLASVGTNKRSTLLRLASDQRGVTAVVTAIGLSVLMGFAGLAIDVGYWQVNQRRMQGAADQASYAAANTANSGGSSTSATTAAQALANANGFPNATNNINVTVNNPPLSGNYTANNKAWEVVISQPQPMWFTNLFLTTAPIVTVRAVGIPTGGTFCALALKTGVNDTFLASGGAVVNLSTCDIGVNSESVKALEATGGSSISVKNANITGNYSGNLTASGKIKTNASALDDPYASRTAPTVGACGSNPTSSGGYNGNYTSPSAATTIYPGVYCGDLAPGGPLTLSPGVYIIKGGSFKVQGGQGTLAGGVCTGAGKYVNATGGVTIYLVPNGSNTGTIVVSACLAITAPSSGNTAGMAFWVDKAQKTGDKDTFSGGSEVTITGALYSPVHEVVYSGSSSAKSSCTQVVAYILTFSGSANFQHNCTGVGLSDPLTNAKLAE